MFLPRARCSHLFSNCWWKIDKSEDGDGDRGRERGRERKRVEKKFLVSSMAQEKKGGGWDNEGGREGGRSGGVRFMRVGQVDEEKHSEWKKR